jgi:hypothetical protein
MADDRSDLDKGLDTASKAFWRNAQETHDRVHHGGPDRVGVGVPAFRGVASVGFALLVGFVAGLLFSGGDFIVAAVAAAVLGAIVFVLRMAFAGGEVDRPVLVKRAAIGAVAGFVVTLAVAFIGIQFSLLLGAIIGLVAGIVFHFVAER